MSQPVLLDLLAKVTIGETHYPLARVFIFNPSPTRPSFIAAYIPSKRKTELVALGEVTSFMKSSRPLRDPHTVTLSDSTTISVYRAAGCGCGSPLKKINHNLALSDWDAQSVPVG